jgi:hypothetical protein
LGFFGQQLVIIIGWPGALLTPSFKRFEWSIHYERIADELKIFDTNLRNLTGVEGGKHEVKKGTQNPQMAMDV